MLSQKWLYNNLGIKVYAQKRTYTYDTVGDTVSDTSKKRNIKNNNISKDIYVFKFNIIYKNSSLIS